MADAGRRKKKKEEEEKTRVAHAGREKNEISRTRDRVYNRSQKDMIIIRRDIKDASGSKMAPDLGEKQSKRR